MNSLETEEFRNKRPIKMMPVRQKAAMVDGLNLSGILLLFGAKNTIMIATTAMMISDTGIPCKMENPDMSFKPVIDLST